MQTVRQPDASRGRAANFWYEVRMRDSKKEEMRRVLVKEQHPVEKLKRIGLGPLTVEGIPRGRYRLIEQKEAEGLRMFEKGGEEKKRASGIGRKDHPPHREQREDRKPSV
jgi:16S rRNA U516 pseudouridylate synthase RsuA-like enzyme